MNSVKIVGILTRKTIQILELSLKESIEFVKVFIDDNNAHVLVAVRVTGTNALFARTIFVMSDEKVRKYSYKNAFKPY